MVLDRLFLWIFTLAVLAGTAGIILQAPTLYDDRIPIDKKYCKYLELFPTIHKLKKIIKNNKILAYPASRFDHKNTLS